MSFDEKKKYGSMEAAFEAGKKKAEESKPTTGKYSHKRYRCTRCGHEQLQGTNHWGQIYPACPKCQWKNPMTIGSVWECLETMPIGYQKPKPWRQVKLGDVCEIVEGVKIK